MVGVLNIGLAAAGPAAPVLQPCCVYIYLIVTSYLVSFPLSSGNWSCGMCLKPVSALTPADIIPTTATLSQ